LRNSEIFIKRTKLRTYITTLLTLKENSPLPQDGEYSKQYNAGRNDKVGKIKPVHTL